MRLGVLTTKARLELRRLVSPYPRLFVPLMRLRSAHEGHVIDSSTEIMIEGAPRSGNTFAVAAFEHAQGRRVKVARHLHGAGHVMEGIRRGVPVLVVCRNPRDSVTSQVIRHPETTLAQALRQWVSFHKPLMGCLDQFVVASFDEITANFGSVIERINQKFGTDFALFDHTEENVEKVFRRVDEMDRQDIGRRADDPAATTARPTASREQAKKKLRQELSNPVLAPMLGLAVETFEAFIATTKSERR